MNPHPTYPATPQRSGKGRLILFAIVLLLLYWWGKSPDTPSDGLPASAKAMKKMLDDNAVNNYIVDSYR
jgi:hypothetical protein